MTPCLTAFAEQGTSAAQRKQLALKTFHHTPPSTAAISDYLAGQVEAEDETMLPATMQLSLKLVQRNRYGENPQQAGLYSYSGDEIPFESAPRQGDELQQPARSGRFVAVGQVSPARSPSSSTRQSVRSQ
ncbi:MAG: hypothetical protein R2851_24350 [Caldilineaceae bacterium]